MAEGSAGEQATASALEALPRDRWRVLHDVPWPGRPRDVVEHVVVGPAGVFVIDSKNWSGTVSVRGGVLRLDKHSRQGAVTHVNEAARAISARLRTARCPVRPVLCLERPEPVVADMESVLVCSTANVVEQLTSQHRVLAEVEIQRLARDLAGPALPMGAVGRPVERRRSARGITYLLGALAALAVTLLLIADPDAVREAVEELAGWVAGLFDDE